MLQKWHFNFWDWFAYDLGIDLGTANILIYIKGKGIMIREPCVIARQRKQNQQGDNIGRVLCVGEKAKAMLGKTPYEIEVLRPLRSGVISDFDATKSILRYYIDKIHEDRGILPKIGRPMIIVGVPCRITEVERKAVIDVCMGAGARQVYVIKESLASAIGAGINILESVGRMIVDIGGGTTEIAIMSAGGIVVNRSLKLAGDDLTEAITNYLKNKYGIVIGELTAEKIKIVIGSVVKYSDRKEKVIKIRGRNMRGTPMEIDLNSIEVREAMLPVVYEIVMSVMEILDETNPDLVADVMKEGIYLMGGGSLVYGVDKILSEVSKIKINLVKDPMSCVARGCGRLIENKELREAVIGE